MFWAQTAAGVWASKSCAFGGTKAPHPLPTFQLQLQPSQLSKSLFKASTKWTSRQCSILQVSRGTGIVSAKLACFCQTDPLLVVNPSSMPLVFRLVLLFFKDFSGLQHWVSWTVYIEVDAQTWVKKRGHRRNAPGWWNVNFPYISQKLNVCFGKFFCENAPRSFWESRCTSF